MNSSINRVTAISPVPDRALTIIDDTGTSGVEYIGYARPVNASGVPASPHTSDAVWLIQRITTAGSVITTEWANGSVEFNSVWGNRASLNYF